MCWTFYLPYLIKINYDTSSLWSEARKQSAMRTIGRLFSNNTYYASGMTNVFALFGPTRLFCEVYSLLNINKLHKVCIEYGVFSSCIANWCIVQKRQNIYCINTPLRVISLSVFCQQRAIILLVLRDIL